MTGGRAADILARMRAAVVLLLVLVLAASAHADAPAPNPPAQGPYRIGSTFQASGPNCAFGYPDYSDRQSQIISGADQQIAAGEKPPRIGSVFYVRLFIGVAGDLCGGGTEVLPEFIAPRGVFLAVSKQRPLLWRYNADGAAVTGGSIASTKGRFGGRLVVARTKADPEGRLWPIAFSGDPLEIYVPYVSSRALSAAPGCKGIGGGDAPCLPRDAGDQFQVFTDVTASTVFPVNQAPTVGLVARGLAKPKVERSGRKLRVTTAPLATVTARVGGRRVKERADRTGRATLKLPRGAKGRATVTAVAVDGVRASKRA